MADAPSVIIAVHRPPAGSIPPLAAVGGAPGRPWHRDAATGNHEHPNPSLPPGKLNDTGAGEVYGDFVSPLLDE